MTDKSELLARWDHLSYREIDASSNQTILGWNYQATSLISFLLNFLGEFTGEEESLWTCRKFPVPVLGFVIFSLPRRLKVTPVEFLFL